MPQFDKERAGTSEGNTCRRIIPGGSGGFADVRSMSAVAGRPDVICSL
jgi:hypothetical protein